MGSKTCKSPGFSGLPSLIEQVEALKEKDPQNFGKKNATKRLAAISKLAFDVIPQDPSLPAYRQGDTLRNDHKHWFRAKFFQQYRLFFSDLILHQKSSCLLG